nr:reverse transcriptase domain-containing protein [Tanacetum cinerariifolium]
MSTRSTAKNIFPRLDNPELTIRRRSRSDPTLLNNSEMAAEGNGDLLVPDLRTMEELCQPSLNGRVHNSCQFHGLSGDDANKHLDKFLHVTQSIKVNGVTDDALRLYLFLHFLTHHATAWFDRLPRNSINTFEQMTKMFLRKYFSPSMVTKLINEITNFHQRPDESLFKAWECYKRSIDRCPNHNMLPVTQIDTFYNGLTLRPRDTINAAAGGTFIKRHPEESLKAEMAEINKNLMRVLQVNQQVKAVTPNYETFRGPHSFSDCLATVGNTQNVYASGAYQAYQALVHQPQIPQPQVVTTNEFTNFIKANDAILKNMQTNMTSLTNLNLELKNMFGQFMKMNNTSSLGSRTLPGNTITNPKEDLKGITTRSGTAYPGPMIPTTSSSLVVERETEATKDTVHPSNNGSTKDVQPPVVQTESPILTSEPVIYPIIKPVASLVSASRPNQRPSIPYPSRTQDQKLHDKANDQREKFFQIFKDLNFNLSFADALILMPNGSPKEVARKTGRPRQTERALIDVFEGELTLRVDKEAITFNLDQMSRYSANYNDMTANRIDVIDMACEEYSQEVLGNYLPEVRKELKIYKAKSDKSSIDEPPKVELKDLPPHLEYVFLEGDNKMPVIIAKYLSMEEKTALITVLKSHKRAIAWKLSDIKGIDPEFCTRKILMEEDFEPAVQHQRRVNPKIHDVIKQEVMKLLDKGLIYLISDSPWDHFPLPFMDQILERLARNQYYYFLDSFSGYFQIPIDPKDQEKTTFTCPYGTFAYRRMPFGLCNAPGTFQRYMMAIFHDMIEKTMEVFMDDFSVFENSFQSCLSHLEKMLKRCEDTNLCLNWEKSHFMVKDGIVLSHKISKEGIEVDKAKVDVISKLPHPTTIKGIQSFLGHAGFYRRCTPYKLVYGKACHLPIEIEHKAYWALKHANFDLQTAGDHRKVQLNELRDQAYENSLIYKEKTKRLHDSKIKDRVFNIDDRVLLFNSRLNIFSCKLKSRWSGPFTISYVFHMALSSYPNPTCLISKSMVTD